MQDLSILNEIIDNVSPNQSLVNLQKGGLGDEDDEEKFKRAFVNGAARVNFGLTKPLCFPTIRAQFDFKKAIDILCVWDCAWIWIKTSELLAILVRVFD
jgi:hypothetical protein